MRAIAAAEAAPTVAAEAVSPTGAEDIAHKMRSYSGSVVTQVGTAM